MKTVLNRRIRSPGETLYIHMNRLHSIFATNPWKDLGSNYEEKIKMLGKVQAPPWFGGEKFFAA